MWITIKLSQKFKSIQGFFSSNIYMFSKKMCKFCINQTSSIHFSLFHTIIHCFGVKHYKLYVRRSIDFVCLIPFPKLLLWMNISNGCSNNWWLVFSYEANIHFTILHHILNIVYVIAATWKAYVKMVIILNNFNDLITKFVK